MEYDRDKVDEMMLALLWLTAFDVDKDGGRASFIHDCTPVYPDVCAPLQSRYKRLMLHQECRPM